MISELDRFVADKQFSQLSELLKTGDDVLDVIDLSEGQHSSILAWMLDPHEGHGQGDEILKDLLVYASIAAERANYLDGRCHTARFFAEYTPSKLRMISLGSSFVATEVDLNNAAWPDICVVDQQNKSLLVIENKHGAPLTHQQLKRYENEAQRISKTNQKISGYDLVFITLDVNRDYAEPGPHSHWLSLSYSWLELSATRAERQVERGNNIAQLVMSYCYKNTGWVSPAMERSGKIASELTINHHSIVQKLVKSFTDKSNLPEKKWFGNNDDDEITRFLIRNKSLARLLVNIRGFRAIKMAVLERIPTLSDHNVEHKFAWMNVYPGNVTTINECSVSIRAEFANELGTRFDLWIVSVLADAATPEDGKSIRDKLYAISKQFENHRDAAVRRISLAENIDIVNHLITIVDTEGKISSIFRDAH